jgi:hypothetical protein
MRLHVWPIIVRVDHRLAALPKMGNLQPLARFPQIILTHEEQEMTPNYYEYLEAIASRDYTLTMLAIIAVSLVTAWVIIGAMPIPQTWKKMIQDAYMIGGIVLYLMTLGLCLYQWINRVNI